MFDDNSIFFLFEGLSGDRQRGTSTLFASPVELVRADTADEIAPALKRIDELCESHFVAGFVSYEAGAVFQKIRNNDDERESRGEPLLYFAAFETAHRYDRTNDAYSSDDARHLFEAIRSIDPLDGLPSDPLFSLSKESFVRNVESIRDEIRDGRVYQVNYTGEFAFDCDGNPFSLYRRLMENQPVLHGAFLHFPEFDILSLSPELFFRIQDGTITVKPMKGTAKRGRTLEEDRLIASAMRSDPKTRSENGMIVDLMRNDLGKIGRPGTIRITELFEVERYRTVLQMTSTIEGELDGQHPFSEILRALFPSGSVTGAPKKKAMETIARLEARKRGVYTGAIGWIAPGGAMEFSVPIRTCVVCDGIARMGAGSGIVYDSDPIAEYEETRLKGAFLTDREEPFALIETMKLLDGTLPFLELHLDRLFASALYFFFPVDQKAIRRALEESARTRPVGPFRLRLQLERSGSFAIELSDSTGWPEQCRVAISPHRTDSRDPFLYHKTTRRDLYAKTQEWCRREGFCDLIFFNERDEATEGAISNLIVEKNGRRITPSLACGLLPGIHRRWLLERGEVIEGIIGEEELKTCDALYLVNALRGIVKVDLVEWKSD